MERSPKISFSATSIEAVRGVLATSHVFTKTQLTDRELWQIYRKVYGTEPFIRIVKDSQGNYRYPEPKILSGATTAMSASKRTRTAAGWWS